MSEKPLLIALVGNPNCGKTTLFNILTNGNCEVGNRSGVTVDVKTKAFKYEKNIIIADLPGIYSLSSASSEEVIAYNYILNNKPDLILNIVDSTSLERNLYLTSQLCEMNTPVIIALNMIDALENSGLSIDTDALSNAFSVPVIPVSAKKEIGTKKLAEEIQKLSSKSGTLKSGTLKHTLKKQPVQSNYRYIKSIVSNTVKTTGSDRQFEITEKADDIALHKYLAIPLFIAVMFIIFQITFGKIGSSISDIVDFAFNIKFKSIVSELLMSLNVNMFLRSLIIDGIIVGIGGIISFFPQIMLLFSFLSLLEASGYMSRTAFITDRLFAKIGLSGNSFVPMLMGFGCSVPAIMATRILENKSNRSLTILLIPFMSCGAKMPVYALICSVFFPTHTGLVIFALYTIGILISLISGIILSRTIFSDDDTAFVLELPPYRIPTLKSIRKIMLDKTKDFAVRVGTVIFLASISVWFLENLDPALHLTANPEESIIGKIGKIIAPIFTPCGFGDWKFAVSLISGIIAKEAIVSTMAVLCSGNLAVGLSSHLSPLSAFSFLIFILLYVPCIATLSTASSELNDKKLLTFSILYQFTAAYTLSMLIFQIGSVFS